MANSLFLDTIYGKVDAKGRVSIPADYRAVISAKKSELVLYPSPTSPCIEGVCLSVLEQMADKIDDTFGLFSEQQSDWTSAIFSQAKVFQPDSTGRILLTQKLLQHARLADSAVFIGRGKTFQLWNPQLYEKAQKQINARVKARTNATGSKR